MADNLSITIGADTSKARHEMELLNAEMRKTQKEIKATADAAAKGDTTAVTKLKAQTAAYDAMAKQLVTLKKEVNGANQELKKIHHAEHAHGFYLVENSVQSLNGALMALGHNLGGGRGGAIAGFVAGIAFTKLIETLNEASKALTEMKKTAGEIGIQPIALQAAQNVVKGIGEEADVATRAMQGMGAQLEEIRKQSIQPPGRVSVFRGGTGTGVAGVPGAPSVQIIRGGQAQPQDFSNPLQMLGIERQLKALPNTEIGKLQSYVIQLQAFVAQAKNFDPTALNIISKTLFQGVPANSMLRAAPALLKQWQQEIDDLEKKGEGANAAAIARNEALIASQAKLKKSFDDATAGMIAAAQNAQIFINQELAKAFDESSFSANLKTMSQQWAYFWGDMRGVAAQAAGAIQTTLSALWGAASSAASNIGQAIAAAPVLPGMASGGYVRGPGTGTSDSIMARLSAGEFVVNAARVRQLGLGFMQQLNGFADGGLVGRFPRFAEGGLVGAAAGGGTPVHLHLDGASYAMHAEAGVAEALVVAARRQQMRSAGVRPSWYGGRAGA